MPSKVEQMKQAKPKDWQSEENTHKRMTVRVDGSATLLDSDYVVHLTEDEIKSLGVWINENYGN